MLINDRKRTKYHLQIPKRTFQAELISRLNRIKGVQCRLRKVSVKWDIGVENRMQISRRAVSLLSFRAWPIDLFDLTKHSRLVKRRPAGCRSFYAFRKFCACEIIATIRSACIPPIAFRANIRSTLALVVALQFRANDRSASRPVGRVGREPKATRFPPATRLAADKNTGRPAPRNAALFNFAWYPVRRIGCGRHAVAIVPRARGTTHGKNFNEGFGIFF